MSLFVLASRDGWVNIMYTGLDAVGVDQQVREIDSQSHVLCNSTVVFVRSRAPGLYRRH